MQLSAAFLICHSFLSQFVPMTDLHPKIHEALGLHEYGQISLLELRQRLAFVDSERGIPLGDCIYEQYARDRVYPDVPFPKPPYNVDQMFDQMRLYR